MEKLNEFFVRMMLKKQEGQGMTEYALIIVVVALAVVVGLGILGDGLNTLFDSIGDKVNGVNVPNIP